MKRTPLIAGNWKMHGSRAAIDRFAGTLQAADLPGGVELLVCVPFVYLQRMRSVLSASTVAVGAQNLAGEVESGAFTGEVNGTMLADIGCSHVIVGHSERRALYGESDGVVARKVDAALSAGLRPILCIGETLEQRDAGETEAVLQRQLRAVLDDRDARTLAPLTIAYEPVWAIGTGHSASAEQAQQAHDFIREQIAAKDVTLSRSMRLLYGGSVKPDNAAGLFAGDDVDGALVGGASLDAASFSNIACAADPARKAD